MNGACRKCGHALARHQSVSNQAGTFTARMCCVGNCTCGFEYR